MIEKLSPDPIDAHVGACIRLRRKMLGMSQSALSGHLGVSFQQLQKYEKGANRVGASRLQRIADVLEVPVSFFFADAPRQVVATHDAGSSTPSNRIDFLASPEGFQLNQAFAKITDPKVRAKVCALVKAVAAEGDS
ncbi:helix-turn-helix transcriptional regulator [Agrobacterium sp. CCNWLW71]|uniref:helix-turn-helix domain-containing protein n=1 Tax=unclassified Agrobacterium TaxID=2632611 RepID=UPI002FF1485A